MVLIPGEPVPKARPRIANGRAYTPKGTLAAERLIAATVQEALRLERPLAGRMGIQAAFFCGTHRRKDLDNMLKTVLDACNGVVYEDDRQIEEIRASVWRGCATAQTQLTFYRLEDVDENGRD